MARILVVGNPYMNYTDALCSGLTELGHTVIFHKHKVSLWDRITFFVYELAKCIKSGRNEFQNVRVSMLEKHIMQSEFDIFMYFNGKMKFDYINENIANILKKRNIHMIVWYMDSIRWCKNSNRTLGYYDDIFSFEKSDISWCAQMGIEVKYLPIGVDTSIYCKNNDLNVRNSKQYDLCFVGTSTPNRLQILEKIAKYAYENSLKMIVYGRWFNKRHWWLELYSKLSFQKKYPYLYRYIENRSVMPSEASELYLKSKICLNIHTSIHEGLNPRTFEILGNGNFELCDKREDFSSFGLIDGRHLVVYSDARECIEKIDFYLKNEIEREKIGRNGQKFVLEKYTMESIIKKGMNL